MAQIGAAIGREFSHALLSAVVSKPEPELASALERLMAAGLLFRQGAPPHANYLFKHALVQDASYGTLLREPRRALHARIAETLERQFTELAESQPELVARHCTEAGLVEKAAGLWGKAGQRSFERSALVEAAEQLRRALVQLPLSRVNWMTCWYNGLRTGHHADVLTNVPRDLDRPKEDENTGWPIAGQGPVASVFISTRGQR